MENEKSDISDTSGKTKAEPGFLAKTGLDLLRIPCARNSFLYGTYSYLGVGLFTFFVTSKPILASHCGFASFITITMGYYLKCRIDYGRKMFEIGQTRQLIERQLAVEGLQNSNDTEASILVDA